MKRENEIIVKAASRTNSDLSDDLAIHIPRKDFGEFVKNLLGQPYEISRDVVGQFDLSQASVNQLIHILNQRITQQNEASLVEFSGKFMFSGRLQKSFSDMDSFLSFVETSDRYSVGVSFKMTYLIKFPNKSIPEKQVVSFRASGYGGDDEDQISSSDYRFVVINTGPYSHSSLLNYRIESTERTWAEDIESLIKNHINKVFISYTKGKIIFDSARKYISILIIISAIAVPFMVEYLRISSESSSIKIPDISQDSNPSEVARLISEMFHDYILIGVNFIHIVYYMVFAVACLFFAILISEKGRERRSFVIFTDKTGDLSRRFREKQKRTPFNFLRDIFIGLGLGLGANYIFLKYSYLLS